MFDNVVLDQPTIVITASRVPDEAGDTPASVTLIDAERIERIGAPLVTDTLRIVPSLSVSSSGPAGSLVDVRIRGAEANHSLLFVEGIRANDPAAGNAPRFELLNADVASRIEVVRGPQSALWGSEAIGGVVAVDGAAPGDGESRALLEYGSFDTARAAARTSFGTAERGLSIGVSGQRSDGIDSFSGDGERDGYRNASGRIAGAYRLSPAVLVGGSGFALRARSEFDGLSPDTFTRDDTLDLTRNRLAAGRLYATIGNREQRFATVSGSLLGSTNRNALGDVPINRTRATRRTMAIEAGQRIGKHQFIAAIEGERETFVTRDAVYGGATNQDRARTHQSLTLEWKMTELGPISTQVAVRHDIFSAFKDATTVRAAALATLGSGFSISITYGQGIAQPTFFDLYGFFPGSFAGNPDLTPEKSRGGEASLRYRKGPLTAALTYYRQRLRYEILDVFAFPLSTTVNATRTSRREGIEVEASFAPSPLARLSATYAWLDASEPRGPMSSPIKEHRRPRHSGSIALDGTSGRLSYGAAVAYTGARIDSDFDLYPAPRVRLSPYWLASGQVAVRIAGPIAATLRVANAFDANYQDVVGYRTEGRSVHGGIRLAIGG
ncbi:MAG: TonB-dependent receptor [Sphingomonas bacterium]|nr:TonB-dependent receptor [Sphingomonas bacterium]